MSLPFLCCFVFKQWRVQHSSNASFFCLHPVCSSKGSESSNAHKTPALPSAREVHNVVFVFRVPPQGREFVSAVLRRLSHIVRRLFLTRTCFHSFLAGEACFAHVVCVVASDGCLEDALFLCALHICVQFQVVLNIPFNTQGVAFGHQMPSCSVLKPPKTLIGKKTQRGKSLLPKAEARICSFFGYFHENLSSLQCKRLHSCNVW